MKLKKDESFKNGEPNRQTQLRWQIGPRISRNRVSPFSGRQPNAVWRWRARRPHTHSALSYIVEFQQGPPLLCTCHSFWRAIWFFTLFRLHSSPRLGGPAAFIEEPPHDDDIVAEHALCHSHPVNLDVGRNSSIFLLCPYGQRHRGR